MRRVLLFVMFLAPTLGVPVAASAGATDISPATTESSTQATTETSAPSVTLDGDHQRAQVADLEPFSMLGVSFNGSGEPQVRATLADGTVSTWRTLEVKTDENADDTAPTSVVTTDPTWFGSATGYELWLVPAATNVKVHLIRSAPSTTIHTASVVTDTAAPLPGGIHLRSEWGAKPAKIHPGMADPATGVQMAIVHHTATPGNDYTRADVAEIVRGFQAYDMTVRHYDDLGYNIMIDQFGGIWEGRTGGLSEGVIGAHAAGFNSVSVGISVIGNFVDREPPDAVIDSIARVAGWKLSLDGYDPASRIVLGAGDVIGHPAHPFPLDLPRIVGHKDVGQTQCPGKIWNALPEIRRRAALVFTEAVGDLTTTDNGNRTATVSGRLTPSSPTAPTVTVHIDRKPIATPTALTPASDPTEDVVFSHVANLLPGRHRVCAFTDADAAHPYGVLIGCSPVTVTDPGLNAIRPQRLLDTRSDPAGILKAGEIRQLQVTKKNSMLPLTATTAIINLTVTGSTAAGWLAVIPCVGAQPGGSSTVNFAKGQTIAGAAISKLDATGTVCFTASTTTHVVVDATGWFPSNDAYESLTPVRLLDTRLTKLQLKANMPMTVAVTGRSGVAATATAAALNVASVRSTAPGWLAVFPCDAPWGGTSNLNFETGQNIANLVVSKLSASGTVCLLSNVTTDVLVDLSGWFPPGQFHPIAPQRLMDTRSKFGGVRLDDDDTMEVPIRGKANVPQTATAVIVNVTATGSKASGWITTYPCAQVVPETSSVNYAPKESIPNLTITQIGTNGCLRISSSTETDVVADVVGWFS